jgi:hypothetical protein
MSRALVRLALAGACAGLLLVAAADPTAEQAAGISLQLQDWIKHMAGQDVAIPEKLIEVKPEGDHYRVTFQAAALPGIKVSEGGAISAAVHPASNGRWTVDELHVASPTKIALAAGGGTSPSGGPVATALPSEMTIKLTKSEGNAVVDPSLASPSTVKTKMSGYDIVTTSSAAQQHIQLDAASADANLAPAANGRLDFSETAGGDNYSSTMKSHDLLPVELAAQHVGVKFRMNSLDPDRFVSLVRELVKLTNGMLASPPAEPNPAADDAPKPHRPRARVDPKILRDLYIAFRGLASGGELAESVDGVRVAAAGHIVGLDHLGLGGGIATADGRLNAHLAFDVAGISAPDIPPEAQAYVPHHFTIKPSISGVNLADLDGIIIAATASPRPDQPDIDAHLAALYQHGGYAVGLDDVDFDVGPAHVTGSAKLIAHAPDDMVGQAELKASGFDALMANAQSTPALAQALPFLAIMRSLAEPKGQNLRWSVHMEKGVVTVNGRDLSALFGSNHDHPVPELPR